MLERRGRRLTFGRILADVRPANSRRLMARAVIANRLAKTVRGRARIRAYAAKHSALMGLSMHFADEVTVCSDPHTPGFVIVSVHNACFGLHAPARCFKSGSEIMSVRNFGFSTNQKQKNYAMIPAFGML